MTNGRILILFGPPGAGKGTQAARLATTLGFKVLSTGELLRATARQDGTKLGRHIKARIDAGRFVEDEFIIAMVFEHIRKPENAAGIILDGFPRTLRQAWSLQAIDESEFLPVINLTVDDEALVQRLADRRYAPGSKRTYHLLHNPPKVAGVCDDSGEPLVQREDDKPQVIRERLTLYHRDTAPVLAYFGSRVVNVDGLAPIDDVTTAILTHLGLRAQA